MKKYFIFFCIIVILIEFFLRYMGFGYPLIYTKDKNTFYPKSDQSVYRFKKSKITINSFGMRTNFDWNNKKNKLKNKIIFFGDSVTFGGSYIDNSELFSEKVCLKYMIKSICGNLGVNGYNLDNIYFRIKNTDKELYDQIIIVVGSSLDLGKSNLEDFPFYSKYDYIMLRSSIEIVNHLLFKYKLSDRYHNKNFTKLENTKNFNGKVEVKTEDFIKLIDKISEKKKVNIFILPTLEDLNFSRTKVNIEKNIKFKNIRLNYLYNYFKNENYNKLYFNNAHLNKKGHEYLTKIIYSEIK